MRQSLLASAMMVGLALSAPAFAQTNVPSSNPTMPSDSKPASAAANTPGAPSAPGAPTAVPPGPPPVPTPPPAPAPAEVPAPPPPPPPPPPAAEAPHAPPAPEAAPAEPAPKPKPKHMMGGGGASNISSENTKGDIAPRLPSPKLGENAGPAEYLMAAKQALKAHRTGEAQESLEMAETRILDRSTTVDQAGKPDESAMVVHIRAALDSIAKKDTAGALGDIDAAMDGKMPMGGMKHEGGMHMHHHHMHAGPEAGAPPTP